MLETIIVKRSNTEHFPALKYFKSSEGFGHLKYSM